MLNLVKVHNHQQQPEGSSSIDLKKQQTAINTPGGVLPPKDNFFKLPLTVEGSEGSNNIALFTRKEIEIGSLVGSGSFSEVFEINGFVNQQQQQRKKLNLLLPRRTKSSSASEDETQIQMMEPSRRRKRDQIIEQHNQHKQDLYSGKAIKSRFVIKHLHSKLLSDPKLYRRALKDLATEVSIMSSIEHPHIVQLHGTALGGVNNATIQSDSSDDPIATASTTTNHDGYFLILDRLQQTLDDRIESWNQEKIRMGPTYYLDAAANDAKMALKANYALQIASALHYLHTKRIVFRDLKPQNIGFKEVHPDHPERDVLALFDFGLSRTLPPSHKAVDGLYKMSMVGTRRYMAPEVVTTRTYDARADTYSWSLVFYELVTQCRPYDGIQRAEHKQFVCQEGKRPKIYDYYGLPADLERLMRYSWAQDITKRLTMDEVCSILQQYLIGTIHENCVRPLPVPQEHATNTNNNNNNNNMIIHDDSISSLLSNGTQNTEQTQSTTNSFTLDNHHPEKDHHHPTTTTTTAAVASPTTPTATERPAGTTGVVPDAVLTVGSITAASSHASDIDEDLTTPPRLRRSSSGRHVSLCERCVDIFRYFRSNSSSSSNNNS